ncbi:ubiquitin activating enzyme [Salix suchowensis]|nr:ubiquitin activating enzyme [Salix suchowensis]
MAVSNVLIVGVKGLGVEIGESPREADELTRADSHPQQRISCWPFFLREGDVGKPRGEATAPRLAELNTYVPVRNLPGQPGQEITIDLIQGFQAVVLCGVPYSKQLEINDWTHQNGVHFIAAETRGLFGSVFNDFGPKFTCVDPTGESPLSGMIVSVDQDKEGLVTCLDETRHGLEDGDFVTFTEVQGMSELNGCEPRKISVKGPYTFSIGDTTRLSPYKTGKPLRESRENPEYFVTDFAKFDRPATLHAGFQALSQFAEQNKRFPRPRNTEDAAVLVDLAKKINADADEKFLPNLRTKQRAM